MEALSYCQLMERMLAAEARVVELAAENVELIEELENVQTINSAAEKLVSGDMMIIPMTNTEKLIQNLKRRATFAKEHDEILYVKADDTLTLLDVIDSTSRVPSVPVGLDPNTKKLIVDFCAALAEKLYNAEVKYGRKTDWMKDDWHATCLQSLWEHIAKGDPRDVAAYCAFMWWHGWSTKPPEGLESRTVTVKLPDYRNTYKSPVADEVEHQVRLALELFSSAAGIKWEAE